MLPLWLDLFQLEGAAELKAVLSRWVHRDYIPFLSISCRGRVLSLSRRAYCRRAREYLGWLLKQRTGTVYVDTHNRFSVCKSCCWESILD